MHPPPHTIAVLPFADMSEHHDQDYFADGMAEEILNLLSRNHDLKVIGRTSSFQFKGKNEDLRRVGAVLGAAYVVDGSVRRSGDRIRVTSQLIATEDGTHRWSENYDRNARDTLNIQEEIAVQIARALELEVTSIAHPRVLLSSEAHDQYLRGMHALERYDETGLEQALVSFQRALSLDPNFAPAMELQGLGYAVSAQWGFIPAQEGFESARRAADNALKLEPDSALAHATLATIHTVFDWDWGAAAREHDLAVRLAPNNGSVLLMSCQHFLSTRQWADGLRVANLAIELDPLNPLAHEVRAWVLDRLDRPRDAEAEYLRVLELAPTYVSAHYYRGINLLMQGRLDEALREMNLETPIGGQLGGLAVIYHSMGRRQESNTALARLIAESADAQPMSVAEVYAWRGEKDEAFKWLDQAYKHRDVSLYTFSGDPLFNRLEKDLRYETFLRRMNLRN
jgi:TolB-like protein